MGMENKNKADSKKSYKWLWISLLVLIGGGFLLTVIMAIGIYFWKASSYTSDSYESKGIYDQKYKYEEDYGLGDVPAAPELGEEIAADISETDTATRSSVDTESSVEQRVIKTGNLSIVVEDVSGRADKLAEIAKSKDGFVQSADITTKKDGTEYGTVIIKVPAADFETTLEEVKGLAEQVTNEKVSGQDITEEYTDLQSQLSNYQAEEQQYLKILESAGNVEEVLKVTDKLSRVRENIEIIEGRMKYLDNLTDLSTITVYLSQEPSISVPSEEWKPLNTLKEAFQTWIQALQLFVDVLIWLIIFLTVPVIVIVIIVKWVKARKNREEK